MFLSNKTDADILEGLTVWVGKERESASYVLHYLREVEERKLYLKEASSLREFCMKVHKYSRHEAQARIDAMRLMKGAPEIDKDIDAGRLSLTVAAQVQSAFRLEDERRKKAGEKPLSQAEKKIVLADMISTTTRDVDRKLATHFPEQPKPEQTKPISQDLTRIGFNADAALMRDLERLKAVYHHRTGGQWQKLFQILATHEIERLDAPSRRSPGMNKASQPQPEKAGKTPTGTSQNVGKSSAARTQNSVQAQHPVHNQHSTHKPRYVRKETHQQVWADWEQGCAHILESGECCGSRQNLQKDHIQEFAKGGNNSRENLRLVCGPHNRYRSDQYQKLRQEFIKRIEITRTSFIQEFARRHRAERPA